MGAVMSSTRKVGAPLRIAVTSRNSRTVTRYAGKTRRLLVYVVDADGMVSAVEWFDMPMGSALHDYHGEGHPVFAVDVVVNAGCGDARRARGRRHGERSTYRDHCRLGGPFAAARVAARALRSLQSGLRIRNSKWLFIK